MCAYTLQYLHPTPVCVFINSMMLIYIYILSYRFWVAWPWQGFDGQVLLWEGRTCYLYCVVKRTCDKPAIVKLHAVDSSCMSVRAVLTRYDAHTFAWINVPYLRRYEDFVTYGFSVSSCCQTKSEHLWYDTLAVLSSPPLISLFLKKYRQYTASLWPVSTVRQRLVLRSHSRIVLSALPDISRSSSKWRQERPRSCPAIRGFFVFFLNVRPCKAREFNEIDGH